ncbi:unnamed protein product, partial [marine sediment metagenome]
MPNTIKTNYTAGEQSPYMDGREDVNKYHNGASKMINATVLPHGGFVKRSGTEYISTAPSKCNLLPFEFSVDDSLVLEFSEDLLRFYKDGSIVNDNVGTEDLSGLDNLVAHWLLNEDEGVVVADDDGGTHNGTSSADTSVLHATGKVGTGSFNLDGQYDVTVPDAADFSFTDNSDDTPFSMACWGNVVDGETQTILSKWRDGASSTEWKFTLSNQKKLQLILSDSSAGLSS